MDKITKLVSDILTAKTLWDDGLVETPDRLMGLIDELNQLHLGEDKHGNPLFKGEGVDEERALITADRVTNE